MSEKIYKCICGKQFTHPNAFNGHKGFCEKYRLSIGKDPNINKELNVQKLKKALQVALNNRKSKHYMEKRKCIICGKTFEVDNFSKRVTCSSKCSHTRSNSGPCQQFREQCLANRLKKKQEKLLRWKASKPKCKYCGNLIDTENKQALKNFCNRVCLAKYSNQFKTEESHIKATRKGNAHHGWYKNIPYDSSFELAFIIYNIECLDKEVSRYKGWRTYIYNNEKHRYYPDFIINDKVYEVKGQLTDIDKAKLEQNKDIILVSKSFINDCRKYCINKYGKKFWELFP